jgi:hypothetical protein
MDEIELTKAEVKGARAKALLEDETLSACFDELKNEYLDYWAKTHIKDTDGRERLFQAFQIVGKVKEHLHKIAANGRLATRDLSNIKTLKR